MTLQFTNEELQLMVELLEEQLRSLDSEIAHTERRVYRSILEQQEKQLDQLENKVIAHDLSFATDELECLLDFLTAKSRELRNEIARTDNREYKQILRNRQEILEHTEDKVTEACCMT
jgi:hypothetical protein